MKRIAISSNYVLFQNEIPSLNSLIQIKRYKLELKIVQVKDFKFNYRQNRTFIFLFVKVFLMNDYGNKSLVIEKRPFVKKLQSDHILLLEQE
jgi:hypothetical protein